MSLSPQSVRTENDGAVSAKIVGDASTNHVSVNASNQLAVDVEAVTAQPLDVSAAEVDVDINSQTLANVSTNLNQVGGTVQSGVDIASEIDTLANATASQGTDHLLVQQNSPLDVSAAEVDVDINSQTLGSVTVTDNGSFNSIVEQTTHDNLNANANIQVGDTDVSNSNPVPVTDVSSGSGSPIANYAATASLAPGNSETISFSISSSTTGEVRQAFVSSEVPFTAELQKFDGTAATTIAVLNGESGDTDTFEPKNPDAALYRQANTSSGEEFRVVATNNDPSGPGNSGIIHVTFEHSEE